MATKPALSVGGTLFATEASGRTVIEGPFECEDSATFAGSVRIVGDVNVDKDLAVRGHLTVIGKLEVGGNLTAATMTISPTSKGTADVYCGDVDVDEDASTEDRVVFDIGGKFKYALSAKAAEDFNLEDGYEVCVMHRSNGTVWLTKDEVEDDYYSSADNPNDKDGLKLDLDNKEVWGELYDDVDWTPVELVVITTPTVPTTEETPATEPTTEETPATEPTTEETPATEPTTEETPATEPTTEETPADEDEQN